MEKVEPAPIDLGKTKKKSVKGQSPSRSSEGGEPKPQPKKDKPEANQNSVQGRWHKNEHDRFIEAIKKFGKDWKSVEQYIETRSGSQIRSHAQKFFNRIIKKYEIDKSEVINFIQNNYDEAESSESATPQKKRKTEGGGDNELSSLIRPSFSSQLLKVKSDLNGEANKASKSGSSPGVGALNSLKKTDNGQGGLGNKNGEDLTHSISNEISVQSNLESGHILEGNKQKSIYRKPFWPSLEQPNEHSSFGGPKLLPRT